MTDKQLIDRLIEQIKSLLTMVDTLIEDAEKTRMKVKQYEDSLV